MKLVVALGNPGEAYKNTRHSVGFLIVDELQKLKLPKDIVIKKSSVFMNESGVFVAGLVKKYKVDLKDLYIIHDDLDILLGSYKIQLGKGPRDHNGVNSIDESLGSNEYWHVRVGVDNRPLDNRPMGEEYVLQNFSDEEEVILDRVLKEICQEIKRLLR